MGGRDSRWQARHRDALSERRPLLGPVRRRRLDLGRSCLAHDEALQGGADVRRQLDLRLVRLFVTEGLLGRGQCIPEEWARSRTREQ